GPVDGLRVHGAGNAPRVLRAAVFASCALRGEAMALPARVITTHTNFAPVAALGRRLAGVPYTVVAHGIDIHARLASSRARALCGADAVWAVSRWSRQRCLDRGVPESSIGIVGNTVDDARFSPGSRDRGLVARYGIAADEKVVLTVARLDPAERYKGYDRVVQALAALRDAVGPVRYLLVGSGDDRARVEQLAAECGVADSVTFCGFVPDDALAAHYRLADAFAMPSLAEGFGIVFLESMACGVPVLGGDRDGSADALADGELGLLVDPGETRAVAAGLAQLLRREGPRTWFEPDALRDACLRRHGRAAFAARVASLMSEPPCGVHACAG
ncbi:glycosyltransferase family 4 protein, partial [Cognatilysobacter lacus]